jgi:hypothetical protein
MEWFLGALVLWLLTKCGIISSKIPICSIEDDEENDHV